MKHMTKEFMDGDFMVEELMIEKLMVEEIAIDVVMCFARFHAGRDGAQGVAHHAERDGVVCVQGLHEFCRGGSLSSWSRSSWYILPERISGVNCTCKHICGSRIS